MLSVPVAATPISFSFGRRSRVDPRKGVLFTNAIVALAKQDSRPSAATRPCSVQVCGKAGRRTLASSESRSRKTMYSTPPMLPADRAGGLPGVHHLGARHFLLRHRIGAPPVVLRGAHAATQLDLRADV